MKEEEKDLGFGDFLTTRYGYDNDHTEYRHKRLKNGAMHEEAEEIEEVMSRSARIKASQRMKRMSKRIAIAKKRALKRAASVDVLKKRADKQARNAMIKKWSRGKSRGELSIAQRAEFEKRLKKMKPRLDRTAKRMVPQLRKLDRDRRSGAKKKED